MKCDACGKPCPHCQERWEKLKDIAREVHIYDKKKDIEAFNFP